MMNETFVSIKVGSEQEDNWDIWSKLVSRNLHLSIKMGSDPEDNWDIWFCQAYQE